MSGKRLRIRVRPQLSDVDIQWIAGQKVGYTQGLAQGKADGDKKHATEKALLLRQITQLEQDLATARAAAHANHQTAEAHQQRMLQLEQECALLRRPQTHDTLFVPPFLMPRQTDESWIANVRREMTVSPGYWTTRTGRSSNRELVQRADAALGGLLNPEQSQRFIRQLINSPGILSQVRTVPMRRPPGNPSFHWSAEHEQDVVDGQPLTELRDLSERVDLQAAEVRAAFRFPLLTGSEMRAPEAEEGVRQASAEGVTNVAGGHSHTIDLDIRVDDSQMHEAITRLNELSEVVGNETVSPADFERMVARITLLERTMGIEEQEEASPNQTDIGIEATDSNS